MSKLDINNILLALVVLTNLDVRAKFSEFKARIEKIESFLSFKFKNFGTKIIQ